MVAMKGRRLRVPAPIRRGAASRLPQQELKRGATDGTAPAAAALRGERPGGGGAVGSGVSGAERWGRAVGFPPRRALTLPTAVPGAQLGD